MQKLIVIIFWMTLLSCSESEVQEIDTGTPPPPVNETEGTEKVVVFLDTFQNTDIVLAGNVPDNFIVSFERELNGTMLDFASTSETLPVIMEDNEGNQWNIFGFAVKGPRKGQRLQPTQSLIGYWFSFATFYPGTEIYGKSGNGPHEGESISGSGDWLVPKNEVRSGGVGRDGIPAISDPDFEDVPLAEFLEPDDLVVGFSDGENHKAYPHTVLDWHEIINDELKDLKYSVIYCPLTGTATVWNRVVSGKETTFGVSGLLYNTNIVPYDRLTESNWSQLFDKSIHGELKGTEPEFHMAVETKWDTWRKLYPTSQVATYNTGFNRNYGNYPYGDYKVSETLIFPVKYNDERLHAKERVHAVIINGEARVYRFSHFKEQN